MEDKMSKKEIEEMKKNIKKSKAKIDKFLNQKNLLNMLVRLVQAQGVIGEELPIMTEILICSGKLVVNKKDFSGNVHVEDRSNVGKDHVTKSVKKVIFPGDWIEFDSPTPTAIAYSQRIVKKKNEKGGEYYGKEGTPIFRRNIVYIKDASQSFLDGADFKAILEGNVNTVKTINLRAVPIQYEKPIIIVTTAETVTGNEQLGRLPSLSLNASEEQTDKIKIHQLEKRCKTDIGEKKNIDLLLLAKQSLQQLKEIHVNLDNVANYIKDKEPKCNAVIMRRLYPRLLDYIMFSTALHQFQRETIPNDSEIPMKKATNQDVDYGLEIFNNMYRTALVDISLLNARQRRQLEYFKNHPSQPFTITEIMTWDISASSRATTIKDMIAIMKVDKGLQIDELKRTPSYHYEMVVVVKTPSKDSGDVLDGEFEVDFKL